MTQFRQPLVALSLAASLLLVGCGAPTAGMVAPKLGKTAPVSSLPAPIVSIQHGAAVAAAPQAQALRASTLRVTDSGLMTDEEIAEDASEAGFQVLAESRIGKKFGKSGVVRTTEKGYSFAVTEGFFKKTTTVYTLNNTAVIHDAMAELENKKAFITGTVYNDGSIDVLSSKGQLDLSKLFNWFTKGRVVGIVKDAVSRPVADAKITVKSADGFLFNTTTDADGEFVVKNLNADDYTVSVTADHFGAISGEKFEVTKRHRTKLEATLEALPAPVPAPTATPSPEATEAPAAE